MKLKHLLIGAALGFPVGFVALAAEPVVCAYGVGTSTAIHTHKAACDPGDGGSNYVCVPDAGGTCTWSKGSTVLVQCNTNVYFDSSTTAGVAGTATSFDQRVMFLTNGDPYPIYLDNPDQNISVLAVTDAGAGECKFMTTKRPKPWMW